MIIIGLAGGSGSGKTYIAERIKEEIPGKALIFSMDRYYKPFKDLSSFERMQINFDRPETLDWELMEEHLELLQRGEAIDMPVYSYQKSTRVGKERVEPRDLVIIEGIYALHKPNIRKLVDLKVFLDLDADIRALRRLKRDVKERNRNVEFSVRQYLNKTKPMHEELVKPTKKYADLKLGSSDTDLFIEKVVELLKETDSFSGTLHNYLKEDL